MERYRARKTKKRFLETKFLSRGDGGFFGAQKGSENSRLISFHPIKGRKVGILINKAQSNIKRAALIEVNDIALMCFISVFLTQCDLLNITHNTIQLKATQRRKCQLISLHTSGVVSFHSFN